MNSWNALAHVGPQVFKRLASQFSGSSVIARSASDLMMPLSPTYLFDGPQM
jgi:hypothetical protein